MCGIAGFAGGFVEGLAPRMNALQEHRGPDGSGVFEDPPGGIALAHRRLAILDLSGQAAQPMTSPDGRWVLIYNGEIYNYRDLRRELEAAGETFVSTGDTEVLLRGLATAGGGFVSRLNGIFAFALWDRRERRLTLARDPLGVKPLYLAEPEPGTILFASEVKALLAHPRLDRSPDFDALLHHLTFCHAAGERTAFRNVVRLAPGTILSWKDGRRDVRTYWRPSFDRAIPPPDEGRETGRLREILERATRRQLVSDVPLGAYFSGGLDSSLIAALARRALPDSEFRGYTITYPASENVLDQADADGPFALRVARELGLAHTPIEIKPEVVELLPKLIYHLDEPLADPAIIACFLVSRLARSEGARVLLSGQGADELFAGYPRYVAMAMTSRADAFPGPLRAAVSALSRALPGSREGRSGAFLRRARRLLGSVSEEPDERFLSYCASSPLGDVLGILGPAFADSLSDRSPFRECLARMERVGLRGASRWLERDLSVYLPNHNLLYTDKMGMAAGVEARVPLLDLEVVEAAAAYPLEWKVSGRRTKILLRRAARGLVPEEVLRRPKGGFGAPYRKWLRHDLAALWEDAVSEASVRRRGWFHLNALRQVRKLSQSGARDLYMLQWAVLTMELWAREFLDRTPAGRA